MAKLMRESRLRDRRLQKQARKAARKFESSQPQSATETTPAVPDETALSEE